MAALGLVAISCQSSGDGDADVEVKEKVFADDGFGITFRYPGVLEPGTLTEMDVSGGGEPTARAVLRLDEDNGILLSRYDLDVSVTKDNLQEVRPELDQLMSQLSPEPGVAKVVELGTLPGVQYDNVKLENPANGKSQLVFLFDQRTEYLLNCQSTPPERAAIDGACERALATLQKK